MVFNPERFYLFILQTDFIFNKGTIEAVRMIAQNMAIKKEKKITCNTVINADTNVECVDMETVHEIPKLHTRRDGRGRYNITVYPSLLVPRLAARVNHSVITCTIEMEGKCVDTTDRFV